MTQQVWETRKLSEFDAPDNLGDFIDWLKTCGEASGVPLDAIGIDIEARDEYGSTYVDLELRWWRDETDQERAAREERESARIAEVEQRERQMLAALKAKYGP